MSHGLYVGKFNNFHRGHKDILEKALKIFDRVSLASPFVIKIPQYYTINDYTYNFKGLLSDFVKEYNKESRFPITAIIRGIRNTKDFEYEKDLFYQYEDSGLKIPVVYFISDRNNCHISSSLVEESKKFGAEKLWN